MKVPVFAAFLAAYLAQGGFEIAGDFYMAGWAEQNNNRTTQQDSAAERVSFKLVIYILLCISKAILLSVSFLMFVYASRNASRFFHKRLTKRVLQSKMLFFDTTPQGRILNRFSSDINKLDTELPMYYSFVRTARQLRRMEGISASPVFAHFSETLTGTTSIRAYRRNSQFIEKSRNCLAINNDCFYLMKMCTWWLVLWISLMSLVFIFAICAYSVVYRDQITSSDFGLVFIYMVGISFYLAYTTLTITDIENATIAIERINEYCENEPEENSNTKLCPASDWPQNGEIAFRNYSTRYREKLEPALRNLSLRIKPCEKIGIAGRTGAGKSSMALSLFRILESIEGSISIDQLDLSRVQLRELRSRIGIIPQDPMLFSETLRFNLDPFQQYSDAQIWNALELSNLKEFVQSLPQRLEHEISEAGSNLSLGQRQLICLARAVLKKPKILVLDEATSFSDAITDAHVQKTIRQQFAQSTILTIAHRLHTILDSDRILALDGGRVAEFDTPKRLLADPNSIFRKLASKHAIKAE